VARPPALPLPVLDRLADGDYGDGLETVEGHTSIDVSAAADALSEKTGLQLNARTLIRTIDAPPAEVRAEFRSMERLYPNTLASIQYDVVDGDRVWEVGSYAYRPEGFFGMRDITSGTTAARAGTRMRAFGRPRRCSRQTSGSKLLNQPSRLCTHVSKLYTAVDNRKRSRQYMRPSTGGYDMGIKPSLRRTSTSYRAFIVAITAVLEYARDGSGELGAASVFGNNE
jgi:hypothetical protein